MSYIGWQTESELRSRSNASMGIIQSWMKGGLLIALIPWVLVGAIIVGTAFRALGVKVGDEEDSDESSPVH